MKDVVYQWVEYDAVTGRYVKKPWYLAIGLWGGRLVSWSVIDNGGVPLNMGIAYEHSCMSACLMFPKPLHLIVRFFNWLKIQGWKIMSAFYWVGLIDIGIRECFRWSDFYRIKSRH